MPAPHLSVHRVSLIRHNQPILKNISFTLHAEYKVAIVGETGSGKSTLLKVIAGLEQPTTGEVRLNGELVKGPAEQLVPGNAQIAYLSQHFELPKFLRVEQILEYVNRLSKTAANQIFSICHINHLMMRKTNELSGGEKQRIAIARLLIQQPSILLLDEPFSHLDIPLKKTLKQVIDDIGKRLHISCMLVSHEPSDTLPWADEILILKKGQIVQQGSPQEIYQSPKNEYAAGLFGYFTLLDKPWIQKLGIKTAGKHIFARPEHFLVVKKSMQSIPVIVTHVQFVGSHTLLQAESNHKIFFIQTSTDHYTIGQHVLIGFKKKPE